MVRNLANPLKSGSMLKNSFLFKMGRGILKERVGREQTKTRTCLTLGRAELLSLSLGHPTSPACGSYPLLLAELERIDPVV